MGLEIWLAQAAEKAAEKAPQSEGLPAWWPIAALTIPLVVTLVVALLQMSSAVKVAKIQSGAHQAAKAKPEEIAEQVLLVLGEELDKRIGPARMAEAQHAYAKGKEEAKRELLEEHQQVIGELQAKLAARDKEPDGQKPEALGAAMLYNAGYDAHMAGKLGEAIGLYSAAILLDGSYAKAYYNRGNAKYDLGDKRGAIEDYDQALHHDPTDSRACYNCGNAKSDLGDFKGAIGDYNESIRLDPTFAHVYYNRGNAKAALGEGQPAIDDYDLSLTIDPTYAAAFYNKACEYAKLGAADQALINLKEAVRLDPRWGQQAKVDPDFDSINETEAFRAL